MATEKNLTVNYMGLQLRNPLIAASSPLTSTVDKIVELERAGIGAVVLKSIFEEQIEGQAAVLERYNDHPQAAVYLRSYIANDYLDSFRKLIRECKQKVSIPIIASINCSTDGTWTDYARQIEEAGADALELNIFYLPTDSKRPGKEIEERYFHIVEKVLDTVSIPVSVKLGIRFTNILNITQELEFRGVKGAVLYNRFFEPDIDLHSLEYKPAEWISSPNELRNSLRYLALISAREPKIDLAVSTGVHSGEDAVKAILSGAKAVELCSTILVNGTRAIKEISTYITNFMEKKSFNTISDFRGLMNDKVELGDDALERVQFMKYFPKEK